MKEVRNETFRAVKINDCRWNISSIYGDFIAALTKFTGDEARVKIVRQIVASELPALHDICERIKAAELCTG